jgi:hypothetical protein
VSGAIAAQWATGAGSVGGREDSFLLLTLVGLAVLILALAATLTPQGPTSYTRNTRQRCRDDDTDDGGRDDDGV